MNSGQNDNRIQKITKFLSDIKSGKLSGHRFIDKDEELMKITQSAIKLNLITGVSPKQINGSMVQLDFDNASLTDKGLEALSDNQAPAPSPAPQSEKVVPINQNNTNMSGEVASFVQQMNSQDQQTAQLLLQALKEGRSNQLVYSDYLDFFNRNPNFYNYFINADQAPTSSNPVSTPKPEQQDVKEQANASVQNNQTSDATNGIFSPEVQRIIAQMEQQPAKSNKQVEPAKQAKEVPPVAKPQPEKEIKPTSKPTDSASTKSQATAQQPQFAPESKFTQQPSETHTPSEPKKVNEPVTYPISSEPKMKVQSEPAISKPEAPKANNQNPSTAMEDKKSSAHVTICYVDQKGNEIAPPLSIQLTSQTSAYDVTSYQKKIHDYNFIKADNAVGHLTSRELKVIFHYEAKIAEGNIRVNYVDQLGEKIAEQKIVQGGHIGEFYPLLHDLPEKLNEQIQSKRYILQSILNDNDPTDSTLIYFTDRDQNFTAVFRELVPGRITLRYRNLKNQSIGIGERIMENNVENGDHVAIPLPLVPTGYELDQTLLNGDPVSVGDQLTVAPEDQVIDYVFKRVIADGAIIFNYVDQDGREIAHSTTVRGGRYGEVYEFESHLPQIIIDRVNEGVYESNPILKEEAENGAIVPAARIIYDNNDHEYSAVYQATEAAKITLRFVTTDDNPIPNVSDKVIQGTHYYGDTFVIPNAPAITGFDLNRVMVNEKVAKVDDPIMYSDQEQLITYVYTIATSTITAHHVDQLGRQITEDRILTGQIGTTIEQSQLVSLRLNPYFVLSDVLTSSGNYTFTVEPQFITFHYQVDDDLVPDVNNVDDINLVPCLDTNGNIIGQVTPNSIHLKQVKVGHVYSVHAPDFAGYHLFSQLDTVRVVWNSEQANDFTIVNHPNGLAFIYQAV
ncbi:MucBP domain-containing protein [Lactobacillus sp.]|uniref:MucBP domain-containing protein n=1 Tax=Lactobacillus sp. TaxID=1591 RepID=UPI002588A1FD|nr:MucBP domain-containing protein [Lactobacillus sp.]MCO6530106.1 MucBP domain-containing protein [Lactobacillus sp.]